MPLVPPVTRVVISDSHHFLSLKMNFSSAILLSATRQNPQKKRIIKIPRQFHFLLLQLRQNRYISMNTTSPVAIDNITTFSWFWYNWCGSKPLVALNPLYAPERTINTAIKSRSQCINGNTLLSIYAGLNTC